jgi:rubredoxin
LVDYMQQKEKPLLCPNCHIEDKENFRKFGYQQLYQRKVQRWQCKRCGKIIYDHQLGKTSP